MPDSSEIASIRKKGADKFNYDSLRAGFMVSEGVQEKRDFQKSKITLREKQVLLLLSDGNSSKIIADKLHISETTAITHRKNLIQKLHVKNTAHLIKVAVLAKIIA